MYTIISKSLNTPVCIRGAGIRVVVWQSIKDAISYIKDSDENAEEYTFVEVDDMVMREIAETMNCTVEDIQLVELK